MKKSLKVLTNEETKHINGGLKLWGLPIVGLVYEIVDVITSNGENIKTAYENGKQVGCGGSCEDL